jgi:hypothetical protein
MTSTAHTIAARLRARVTPQSLAQHRFSGPDIYGGLQVTLRIDREDYVLSLTRHGSEPTDSELLDWRRAFGVPKAVIGEREEVNGYWVRRVRWPMATQLGMKV